MTSTKPPRAPSGLNPRGRALWRDVTARFELDPGEFQLLRELCRTVDQLDAIACELAQGGLMVTGSRGQIPKSNPMLFELRETQKTMSRLVNELALPMAGEQVGRRRSPQQRHAATLRWRANG